MLPGVPLKSGRVLRPGDLITNGTVSRLKIWGFEGSSPSLGTNLYGEMAEWFKVLAWKANEP